MYMQKKDDKKKASKDLSTGLSDITNEKPGRTVNFTGSVPDGLSLASTA